MRLRRRPSTGAPRCILRHGYVKAANGGLALSVVNAEPGAPECELASEERASRRGEVEGLPSGEWPVAPKSAKNDKPKYGGLIWVKLRPAGKVKFAWNRRRVGLSGGDSAGRPVNAAEAEEFLARTPGVPKLEGCRREAPLQASEECEQKSFSLRPCDERNGEARTPGSSVKDGVARKRRAADGVEKTAVEAEEASSGILSNNYAFKGRAFKALAMRGPRTVESARKGTEDGELAQTGVFLLRTQAELSIRC